MLRALFCLLLLLVAPLVHADTELPKATTFMSPDGGFSIRMPTRPDYSEQQVRKSEETEDRLYEYVAADDNAGYVVSYIAFKHRPASEQARQAVYAKQIKPSAPGGKAIHLFRNGEVNIAGIKGVAIDYPDPAGGKDHYIEVILATDTTVYCLQYNGTPGPQLGKRALDWFGTFKLLHHETASAGWVKYQNVESNVRIDLPKNPAYKSSHDSNHREQTWRISPDANGFGVQMGLLTLKIPRLAREDADLVMETSAAGYIKGMPGYRATATTRLGFDGWPGLDFQLVAGPDGEHVKSAGTLRLILVNNLLYSVIAVSGADQESLRQSAAVFDSFQFIKPAHASADR